jgi:hypothetical protein
VTPSLVASADADYQGTCVFRALDAGNDQGENAFRLGIEQGTSLGLIME